MEASMAAAHYKLDNLVLFVDHNGLQIDGRISEVLSPEPIRDKFEALLAGNGDRWALHSRHYGSPQPSSTA